jgi:hypothetical protein
LIGSPQLRNQCGLSYNLIAFEDHRLEHEGRLNPHSKGEFGLVTGTSIQIHVYESVNAKFERHTAEEATW